MGNTSLQKEIVLRVKTGLLVGLCIGIFILTPIIVVGIFVIVLSFFGAQELTKMLANSNVKNHGRLPNWLLPGSAIIIGIGSLFGVLGLHSMMLLCAFGWIFYELVFTLNEETKNLSSLGIGLFGMIWIVWSISHITLIKALPNGTTWLFFLIIVVSSCDIFAYFGGKHFGKSLLAPTISPKKTWEGFFFGILGGGIVGSVFCELTMTMFWLNGFLFALVLSSVGQLSDLVESKVKRICKVKDSGTILPGHGGILDRIDAHIISAPVFYYFIQF